jgi:hypothetical protein
VGLLRLGVTVYAGTTRKQLKYSAISAVAVDFVTQHYPLAKVLNTTVEIQVNAKYAH